MIKSLFISRELNDVNLLNDFCKRNSWKLSAKSLIEFNPIDFKNEKDFDVIYFSSRRAVFYYLSKVPISFLKEKMIACSGPITSESIKEYGVEVDYMPVEPGNIAATRSDFHNWLGNKTVMFPCSDISLKSILTGLVSSQFKIVEIYQTILSPIALAHFDIYVFTSPSNVSSFFKKNSISKDAYIISWGDSTNNCLNQNSYKSNIILSSATMEELIEHLLNL